MQIFLTTYSLRKIGHYRKKNLLRTNILINVDFFNEYKNIKIINH
jgi:hypothetical protein